MILHYVVTALRNLSQRPLNTVIKLLALSLGLACLLTAHVIGDYFSQADRNWSKASRTYVVVQETAQPGGVWESRLQSSSPPVAKYLRADFPELETVARLSLMTAPVGMEGRDTQWQALGADPEFLEVFDLDMVAGEASLGRPDSILLDEEVAQQAFGSVQAAINQTMTLNGGAAVTIRGVFSVIEAPSHLALGLETRALVDMATLDAAMTGGIGQRISEADDFRNSLFVTYVVLPTDGSLTEPAFNRRLEGFSERRAGDGVMEIRFSATPMRGITRSRFSEGLGNIIGVSGIAALYLMGALTLAIGCVNFASLSVAEATNRAKEIGLRKVLGATRRQVGAQMLVESGIVAVAAMILVLPLSAVLAKILAGQFNQELVLPGATRPDYWIGIAAIAVGVAIAAGSYPALVLARLRPTFAIRMGGSLSGGGRLRSMLISAQFAAAGFLLTLVMVMAAQSSNLRDTVFGPDRDPIVTVNVPPQTFGGLPGEGVNPQSLQDRLDGIRQQIMNSPAVSDVTFGPNPPFALRADLDSEFVQSLEPGAPRVSVQNRAIYFDYFRTLETPVLAGRTFSRERDESRSVVIDAATAELFGFLPAEAVGKSLYRIPPQGAAEPAPGAVPIEFTIVGVVDREPLELKAEGPTNYLYILRPTGGGVYVKISKNDIPEALAHIRETWSKLFPGQPVEPVFLDDAFDAAYRNFTTINTIFIILSGIAVAIAVMGLFGLASFLVQRRVREVGVRKALGASSGQILGLLMLDFSKPVLIAGLIASPFAFVAARFYLNGFVSRIDLTPLPFLCTLFLMLAIAWITVGMHAWNAARVKPAKVLKYE